VGNIRLSKILW